MHFDSSFSGRIIQVTEALSYQDAVSNQVLALDDAFRALGFESLVFTKWHDQRHEQRRRPVEELSVTDKDVVIYHFYGYAGHTPKIVQSLYCTRIVLYHNITPHTFFPADSPFHAFCKRGREQLVECLSSFHYFWADSQFNLDELISLGAPPEKCAVVPIIVPEPRPSPSFIVKRPGVWLFLGRISPNKDQLALVDLFAQVRRERPDLATELHLVGGFEEGDSYGLELRRRLEESSIAGHARLHGKVSDAQREAFFQSASVFVSMSQHEGFGVPLIEAGLRDLPVLALGGTAVSETLDFGPGVAADAEALKCRLIRVMTDAASREEVLRHQRTNVKRFAPEAVSMQLQAALRQVLPSRRQYRRVSVVICTYNRCGYLERVLDYLCHQSSGDFEVIVVDGPSTDDTPAVLSRYGDRIKVGRNPERNLSMSRNIGIELADGDVIAFIDDDALPFDNWVENILAAYNERPLTTAGLGGPAYYAGTFWFQAQDNGINRRAEASVNIASDLIGKDGWWRYNTGTNATFSAAALREAGGFDEEFDYYLDESEVCFRLQQRGWLVAYASEVVVRHEFAQSHNRQGKLNYNWYTICKNTAYFVSAYSGLEGRDLTDYLDARIATERIGPIAGALAAGDISQSDHDGHVDAIRRGVAQGLADARQFFPRRRVLETPPLCFRPYDVSRRLPTFAAGRKQLHVCIVSKEFPPFAPGGGIGTLYYHLASELLLMGHRVTAVVPGQPGKVFEQGSIKVHFAETGSTAVEGAEAGFARNMAWSLSALTKVAEIHAAMPIDVIDSALWDTEALAIALIPSGQRPPIVVRLVTPYAVAAQINGWSPPVATTELFVGAELALMAQADAVVPISESIASTIEKAYNVRRNAKWHAIPCGIAYWPFFDVNQGYDDFPQLEGAPHEVLESGKYLLFVGRLETRKGIDLILKAAPHFLSADPEAHLVIAGRDVEGWVQRIPSLVPDAMRGRIHVVGEVTDAIRDKLMARAYCLLFPSRYESFGLVPLEGFVHGVPVVATNAGAIPEVVEDGLSGLVVATDDVEALASAVLRLLKDPALRATLSAGALRAVRRMSGRNSAVRTHALYEQLARAACTSPALSALSA